MSKARNKKRQIAQSKISPASLQQASRPVTTVQHQRQEFYQGALPHPEHLARFDEVLPGLANRIMVLTESEQAAAHAGAQADQKFRQDVLDATIKENKRKHFTALFALALCLATSVVLAYLGATIAAATVGGTTVVGVVASFLGSKLKDVIAGKKEAKNK